MRIASTIGATSVQHDGVDYEAGEDGMFEVPEEVGQHLLGFSHWATETSVVEADLERRHVESQDPAKVAERLALLETHVESALEAIVELRAALEALKAAKPASRSRAKSTD